MTQNNDDPDVDAKAAGDVDGRRIPDDPVSDEPSPAGGEDDDWREAIWGSNSPDEDPDDPGSHDASPASSADSGELDETHVDVDFFAGEASEDEGEPVVKPGQVDFDLFESDDEPIEHRTQRAQAVRSSDEGMEDLFGSDAEEADSELDAADNWDEDAGLEPDTWNGDSTVQSFADATAEAMSRGAPSVAASTTQDFDEPDEDYDDDDVTQVRAADDDTEPMMEDENGHSGGGWRSLTGIAGVGVGALGVLLAAGALWWASDAGKQGQRLRTSLDKLEQKVDEGELAVPSMDNIEVRLETLEARISESDTRLDGALDQQRTVNQQALDNVGMSVDHLATRVDALTEKLEALEKKLATKATVAAKPAPRARAKTKPAARKVVGQQWAVNLATLSQEPLADKEVARLRKLDVPAVKRKAVIKGRTMYRVSVRGLTSVDAARQYVKRLEQQYGMRGAWVERLSK